MLRLFVVLVLALGSLLTVDFTFPRPARSDSWNQLADDYISQYLAFSPTDSTQVGVHIHDSELDDYRRPLP